MGFKSFFDSLKQFGDVIESTTESVLDEAKKTFDGLDADTLSSNEEEAIEKHMGETVASANEKAEKAADTLLSKLKNGLIFLEPDHSSPDDTEKA